MIFLLINISFRELQSSLKKSYLGQHEKTMKERKLLIKEKYEIEAHLQTLQNQLLGLIIVIPLYKSSQ